MIFAAVGTQKFKFDRMLKLLDEYAKEHRKIFAQTGSSDYVPKYYEHKAFLDKESFEKCINGAELVITHGGVGTILSALKAEKPVIVIPRLSKYGEHIDDHQLEIAEAFERKGLIICCGDNECLENVIEKAMKTKFKKYKAQNADAQGIIRDYLKQIS